jgi:hypothetical protein
MGRRVGTSLNGKKILVDISLMSQVQALLADIEHLVLGTVDSS